MAFPYDTASGCVPDVSANLPGRGESRRAGKEEGMSNYQTTQAERRAALLSIGIMAVCAALVFARVMGWMA